MRFEQQNDENVGVTTAKQKFGLYNDPPTYVWPFLCFSEKFVFFSSLSLLFSLCFLEMFLEGLRWGQERDSKSRGLVLDSGFGSQKTTYRPTIWKEERRGGGDDVFAIFSVSSPLTPLSFL